VVSKLEANSTPGSKVLVSQCCGGTKLFATLKFQGIGKKRKLAASNWRAEDATGRSLTTEKPTTRTREVVEGRLKESITETLVVISSQKLCFIVDQQRQPVK